MIPVIGAENCNVITEQLNFIHYSFDFQKLNIDWLDLEHALVVAC
jgi:hypothetical protein